MKRTILSNVLVALIFLLGAGAAHAQTVIFDPSVPTQAIGIDNLDVNGTTYNVDFSQKTNPNAVYGSYPGVLDFNDQASAEAAMDAVDLALNGATGVETVGAQDFAPDDKYIIGFDSQLILMVDNLIHVTSSLNGVWARTLS